MDETLLLSLLSMDTYDRINNQTFLLTNSQSTNNVIGDVQIATVKQTTPDGFSTVAYKLRTGQYVISY